MSTSDEARLTKTIELMLGRLVLRFGVWLAICLVSLTATAVMGYRDIKEDLKTVIAAQAQADEATVARVAEWREWRERVNLKLSSR